MTSKTAPKTRTPRPLRPVMTPADSTLVNVLLSAVMGAACGDALGTTLEFTHRSRMGWDFKGPYGHDDIVGKGPFNCAVGEVTDDTQMAVGIARAITADRAYRPASVVARFQKWREVAFDIGGTTSSGISQHRAGTHPLFAVPVRATTGANGALMRATPLGVWQFRNRRAVLRNALSDAMLTHNSAECCLLNAAYASAIARLLSLRSRGTTTLPVLQVEALKAARWALREGAEVLRDFRVYEEGDILRAVLDASKDLRMGQEDDPMLYGEDEPRVGVQGAGSGGARTAFRLAWWQLFHAPSYRVGVTDTVNRGGDADTTGAIVGGLLGALFGLGGRKGIPSDWLEAVEDCHPNHTQLRDFHPGFFRPFAILAAGCSPTGTAPQG